MADTEHPNLHLDKVYTGPDGNLSRHTVIFDIATATTYAADDEVFLAHLPMGMEIHNVRMIVTDELGTGDNIDLGLVQKGSGDFTDDIDQLLDGSSIASKRGEDSNTGVHHKPILIEDPDVFLKLKFNTAISASEGGQLVFLIDYVYQGNL